MSLAALSAVGCIIPTICLIMSPWSPPMTMPPPLITLLGMYMAFPLSYSIN